ncbi:MAG TPA: hypothetical protein EYH01_02090 [Campylobacterales bacterium]|nr:hypothetical protein [Campylobacterales bacterium]
MSEIDPKSSRLACQKEATTFETIRKPEQMSEAIKALKSGNYELDSEIRFSKYMKSQLGKYLSVEDVDKMLKEVIGVVSKPSDNALIIDYSVYENDKKDPGKKTKKSKLYAGYIYMNFKIGKTSVYDIQIDYKDLEAKDLKKRIECAISSFLSADL